MTERDLGPYWSNGPDELAATLRSGVQGLTSTEAETRLRDYGPNALDALRPLSRARVLLNQVRSPLLLLLILRPPPPVLLVNGSTPASCSRSSSQRRRGA